MDDRRLSRSPSISSFGSNHSSWSFVGDEDDFDSDTRRVIESSEAESNGGEKGQPLDSENTNDLELNGQESEEDEDDSASEEEDEEEEEGTDEDDEEDEEDSGDDSDDDDDDMSMISEEDVLSDTAARKYIDAVKVSKQLDELSKYYDSPFNRMFDRFLTSERNIRIMVVISVAAAAVAVFYTTYGVVERGRLPLVSLEIPCDVNEDGFVSLQYCDAPSVSPLLPSIEVPLKPSLSSSIPPSSAPPPVKEPFTWVLNPESIGLPPDKRVYLATNQCDRFLDERQFNAMNEAVRRYVKHTEALRKLSEHESDSDHLDLSDMNKTLNDAEAAEPHPDGKLEEDCEIVKIFPAENQNSIETEVPEYPEPSERRTPELVKPTTSIPKPTLPIPPFSANYLPIEPKFELPIPIPPPPMNLNLPLQQRRIRRILDEYPDFSSKENPSFEVLPVDVKIMDEERRKPRHANDLDALLADLNFPELDLKIRISGKRRKRDSEKDAGPHRSKKGEHGKRPAAVVTPPVPEKDVKPVNPGSLSNISQEHVEKAISLVKKTVMRSVERAKAHSSGLLKKFKSAVDKIATQKQQKKVHQIKGKEEQTTDNEERCVLNSTCTALASLARTLAGINLFPSIVGQTNAAKYIDSLLDLAACTGMRLVCEKCWWTKESCPKERCPFLPWQRHFNTKRFLHSQHDKMTEPFRELGWTMPKRKRKGDDGELKFEPDHPDRPAGSKNKMFRKDVSQQNRKKSSSDWYSKKGDGEGRVSGRKTGVH